MSETKKVLKDQEMRCEKCGRIILSGDCQEVRGFLVCEYCADMLREG